MEYSVIIIAAASLGAFFMAFNNGANDVANSFAPTVGSGALTLRQATVIASILNFIGAVLLGSHVTSTLISGIVHPAMFDSPLDYILAMLSALIAAGCFVLLSTLKAIPVSSSQSIVGGLTGVAVIAAGWGAVNWPMMLAVVLSWFASILISALLAFGIYGLIRLALFSKGLSNLPRRLVRWFPVIVSFTVALMSYTLLEGTQLRHYLNFQLWEVFLFAGLFACSTFLVARAFVLELILQDDGDQAMQTSFQKLQVASASFVAFGHGANDVANSISPVVAIVLVVNSGAIPTDVVTTQVPLWILAIGGFGIALGITVLGRRVIVTLGERITRMNSPKGFSVNLATSTTVVVASMFGLPISTTHAATGSVMGAGISDGGMAGINWRLLGRIALTWLITVPVAGAATALVYLGMHALVSIL